MRFSILANRIMVLLLFQPIRFKYVSFDIELWKRAKVVKSFGNFFTDEHYHACCRSHAFDLHTTVTVQNFTFLVVIDTWHRSTQVIIVQLEQVTQAIFLFIRGVCSTRLILSDDLSPYQGKLNHLMNLLRQAVTSSAKLDLLDLFDQTT